MEDLPSENQLISVHVKQSEGKVSLNFLFPIVIRITRAELCYLVQKSTTEIIMYFRKLMSEQSNKFRKLLSEQRI